MRQYRIKKDWHPVYKGNIYTPQFKLWGLIWVNLVGYFGGRESSWFVWLSHAEETIEDDIEHSKNMKLKPTYIKYPNE
jgi:hypothetical protein